jgi:Flp pilus assembly protein TadB
MSKQRQAARAEREAAAAAAAERTRAQRERDAAARARRERRATVWRRVRLWQKHQRRGDTRERTGALVTLDLLVLIAVFVVTRSAEATLGTALILLIGTPVLVMIFFDRRRR